MTTVSAPTWTPWTSYYDSTGQGPAMVASVAGDGLNVQFLLDRFVLSLQGAPDAPFAGAAGLSGALSVDVPADFNMAGFLLVVNGHLEKTPAAEAVVTCSVGHGTQSVFWPLSSPKDRDPVTGSDFHLECFTSDYNPVTVGVPPYPPLPPFPVTLSMQARRRTADDAVDISVTDFTVILLGSL